MIVCANLRLGRPMKGLLAEVIGIRALGEDLLECTWRVTDVQQR